MSSLMNIFEPSMPVSESSQLVIVVPIFAPIMIPTTWCSVIIFELTKPTAITVTAEELWITAVTPAPRSRPLSLLLVIFSSIVSSLPPLSLSREVPI